LDEEGHRQAFAVVGERVSRLSAEEFQATLAAPGMNGNLAHSLLVARDNYEKLGHRSLIGWDYSRYISLCRWGYLVGSLTEEEAWQRVMHAAQIIQGTFASWRELGENYLIGRDFWSYEATRRDGQIMRATCQELLRKPQSPWNQIPWNLDLE
jgi:hypothetical protein